MIYAGTVDKRTAQTLRWEGTDMPCSQVVPFVGGPMDGIVLKRSWPLGEKIPCYVFRDSPPESGTPGQAVQVDTFVYRLEQTAPGQYVYVCQETR